MRKGATRLAVAATSGAVSSTTSAHIQDTSHQPYHAEYQAALSTEGNVLASPAYQFLLQRLHSYRALQAAYAVKQSDIERARKAAAMCGLEMTGSYRGPRRAAAPATGAHDAAGAVPRDTE